MYIYFFKYIYSEIDVYICMCMSVHIMNIFEHRHVFICIYIYTRTCMETDMEQMNQNTHSFLLYRCVSQNDANFSVWGAHGPVGKLKYPLLLADHCLGPPDLWPFGLGGPPATCSPLAVAHCRGAPQGNRQGHILPL